LGVGDGIDFRAKTRRRKTTWRSSRRSLDQASYDRWFLRKTGYSFQALNRDEDEPERLPKNGVATELPRIGDWRGGYIAQIGCDSFVPHWVEGESEIHLSGRVTLNIFCAVDSKFSSLYKWRRRPYSQTFLANTVMRPCDSAATNGTWRTFTTSKWHSLLHVKEAFFARFVTETRKIGTIMRLTFASAMRVRCYIKSCVI
jgi:hypothetical protein